MTAHPDIAPEVERLVHQVATEASSAGLIARKDRLRALAIACYAAGERAGLEKAAGIAESWRGKRLGGSDDLAVGAAFGRGVDMAAHYIAAAIRASKEGA